jgi:EAL domain-containing protein (putative c-di-GMP-specific phosphodiesterase class I)
VLKIDKSFVDPLVSDGPQEVALVSTIIDFAHVLGLRTVAEGVETATQLARLRSLGCASVQGFLLSGPLDPNDASDLIADVLPAPESAGK